MAAFDEDAIREALFQRLKTKITGLKFTRRGYLEPDQIAPEQQPAMLVAATRTEGDRPFGTGTVWTMRAVVVFYVRTPADKSVTVETTLLGLIKQVDAALQRPDDEPPGDDDPGTTLGGLVFRCFRLDHEIYHGADSGQAEAYMTIEMVRQE